MERGEGFRTLGPLLGKHAGRGISGISGRGQLLPRWQGNGSEMAVILGVSRVLRARPREAAIDHPADSKSTVRRRCSFGESTVWRAHREESSGRVRRGPIDHPPDTKTAGKLQGKRRLGGAFPASGEQTFTDSTRRASGPQAKSADGGAPAEPQNSITPARIAFCGPTPALRCLTPSARRRR